GPCRHATTCSPGAGRLVRRVDLVAPRAQLVAVAGGVELVGEIGRLLADAAERLELLPLLGEEREVVGDRVQSRDGLVHREEEALHQLYERRAAESVVPGGFHRASSERP